eukprot:2926180-Pyramimonas_sp.AAC.1
MSPDVGRLETIEPEACRRFRPLGARAGPRDRQKTTRDEKQVPRKWPGGPGPESRKNRGVGCPGPPTGGSWTKRST